MPPKNKNYVKYIARYARSNLSVIEARWRWFNGLNIDTYDISMILDDEVMA